MKNIRSTKNLVLQYKDRKEKYATFQFFQKKKNKYQLLKKQNIGHKELHDLTKKIKTYINMLHRQKIEPLNQKPKEYIYVYNETNRKISRLDIIDKKKTDEKKEEYKQTKKSFRTGSEQRQGGGEPAGGDISSSLYVFFLYNFFLSHTPEQYAYN